MISSLFVLAAIAPQEAMKQTYVFPGMPTVTVAAGTPQPEMMWHSVTITLGATHATVEATSLFRNLSDKPIKATLGLPMYVVGTPIGRISPHKVLWNNATVNPSQRSGPFTIGMENIFFRNRGATNVTKDLYPVSFPAKAQQSVKTSVTVPISKVDLDGVARQVSYRFEAQPNMLSSLQVAIKYDRNLVFSPIGATPQWGEWQIGANGAFMKRTNVNLPEPREMSFQYYPNDINPGGG